MISAITGELRRVEEDRIHVQCGAILYELLVPASDLTELQASLGETLTFHTVFYLEGDASRGGLEPRLVGFLRPDDRRFFEKFTTVKGIGPKTALKALTAPVGQIALAIESKDARALTQLKGIGKRTAELIVAELAGKVGQFAVGYDLPEGKGAPGAALPGRRSPAEEDAIEGLMALGEPRAVAQRLLERVIQTNPSLKRTDAILREMLRMRTVRA
jgi:Holliday junction DNA helicase RuvA